MDQTGIHLVPAARFTYERAGSKTVAVVGAEDKRQITVCVAASLRGDLLPLQLIFQGKTSRSLPPATANSIATLVDVTQSSNHWSSQLTMQRYITQVIMKHAERMIEVHGLASDAHIVLLLDAWSVHKSVEFRQWIAAEHPRIHLVYVPANCTSKLQLADVALQRPFKHGVTERFNQWAAEQVSHQLREGKIAGIADLFTMKKLKPLVLEWCCQSWRDLRERKQLILDGWDHTCVELFNVHSPQRRSEAVNAVALNRLDVAYVPEETESDGLNESDSDEDGDEDELDLTKPVQTGKKTGRKCTQTQLFGYRIDSTAIEIDSEEDLDREHPLLEGQNN
jgi:hypothetical protein